MKIENFYFRFLFVLLLLSGFTSVKAADPIVVYAYADAITIFQTKPDVLTGLNGSWMYIGGEAAHGTYLEYNIPIQTAGTYDIQFVAATLEDRHFFAQVNNQLPVMVKFTSDNYSSDWNTNDGIKTIQVYFDAGDDTLRLSAYQNDGKRNSSSDWSMPLLDRFIISPSEINVSKLADEYSVEIEAQNTTERTGDWANIDNSFMDGTTEIPFHGISGQTGYVKYDFEIPEGEEGFYNMVINYSSWDERHINLVVNEDTPLNQFAEDIQVWCSGNWGGDYWCWWDQIGQSTYRVMTQFYLPAGTNSIKFAQNTSTDFDGKYPNIAHLKLMKFGEYVAGGTGIITPNTQDVSVYGLDKMIVISSPYSAAYTVYDLTGKIVSAGISSANRKEIPASAGTYIVKVNNIVKKVIVR